MMANNSQVAERKSRAPKISANRRLKKSTAPAGSTPPELAALLNTRPPRPPKNRMVLAMHGFYMINVYNTLTIFSKALVVHSWSSTRARRINGNHTKKSRKGKPSGRAQGAGGANHVG